MYRVYADGREFGKDYPSIYAAHAARDTYAASFPGVRYVVRALPVRRIDRHNGCQDCGQNPVREIAFHGGMRYWVCADHEREYCGPRKRNPFSERGVATLVR